MSRELMPQSRRPRLRRARRRRVTRQEQLAIEPRGMPPGRAVPLASIPEEKITLLVHFETEVQRTLLASYQRLPPSPAQPGLLGRDYLNRLRLLKATLRAKRQQLVEQRPRR